MDTNETPVGTTSETMSGEDRVFQAFRQLDTPVRTLCRAAIVVQVILFAEIIFDYVIPRIFPAAGGSSNVFRSFGPFAGLVFPFIPGIIVHSVFKHTVIPSCLSTCSVEEIVSGAKRSLWFMWGRFLPYLLPSILACLGCFFYLEAMVTRSFGASNGFSLCHAPSVCGERSHLRSSRSRGCSAGESA